MVRDSSERGSRDTHIISTAEPVSQSRNQYFGRRVGGNGYELPRLRDTTIRGLSAGTAPPMLARRQCDGVMCSTRLKLRVKAAWSQNPQSSPISVTVLAVSDSNVLAYSIRS